MKAARVSAVSLLLIAACGTNAPDEPLEGTGGMSAAGSPATPSGGMSSAAGSVTTTGGSAGASSAGTAGVTTTAGSGNGGSVSNGGASGGPSAGGGGTSGSGGSSGGSAGTSGSAGTGGNGGSGGGGPKQPLKVWLAGDSTMQNCSSACPCGWGSRFDELFDSDVTVVNRAVGGRSIQTWLYEGAVTTTKDAGGECTLSSTTYAARWNEMLDAGTGMKAGDYLFIQFGINDSDSACPRHVGQEKFKSYLTTMAQAATSRGAKPIFVTPVSAIKCSGSSAVGTRGSFVTSTQAAATAAGVTLIDLHQLSFDRYTALGLCPNDENYGAGKVGAFFCEDHTHFETAGALEIAKLVAGATSTAKLPLAGYLLP